mmetsp:Transcript_4633/g.12110  ORF Transcript_4633/g.12110 Transcript_4633/m.12110 type:complete len:81 (-) Transcript_4633:276-518(-)
MNQHRGTNPLRVAAIVIKTMLPARNSGETGIANILVLVPDLVQEETLIEMGPEVEAAAAAGLVEAKTIVTIAEGGHEVRT